jgi:hypothetical protein
VLSPEDYAAFQQLAPGLPDSYEAWHDAHVEELRAAYRLGEAVVEVVVYAGVFAEFLREHGLDGSVKALETFAIEKAVAATL